MTRLLCSKALLGGLLYLLSATTVFAHEIRPAYLEIREISPQRYDVLWKRPLRGGATEPIDVALPGNCTDVVPKVSHSDGAASVERRSVQCEASLAGETIIIDGLAKTLVETIVRFQRLDGTTQTARLMAGTDSFVASKPSTFFDVAGVYLPLGFEHILLGFDHLCFVLVLLFLISGIRRLVWTITAFTLAHSLTLSAATLGYVSTPSGPVEALIALSIVLVAAEVIHLHRGRDSATAKHPWVIAFGFGLLHGLGFAGALTATGLPDDAIPLALLFFNIGVELGQLAFVAVALAVFWVIRRYVEALAMPATMVGTYIVGTLAAFWTIERVLGFAL